MIFEAVVLDRSVEILGNHSGLDSYNFFARDVLRVSNQTYQFSQTYQFNLPEPAQSLHLAG